MFKNAKIAPRQMPPKIVSALFPPGLFSNMQHPKILSAGFKPNNTKPVMVSVSRVTLNFAASMIRVVGDNATSNQDILRMGLMEGGGA